jgi:hypothetical protein
MAAAADQLRSKGVDEMRVLAGSVALLLLGACNYGQPGYYPSSYYPTGGYNGLGYGYGYGGYRGGYRQPYPPQSSHRYSPPAAPPPVAQNSPAPAPVSPSQGRKMLEEMGFRPNR